MNRRYSNTYTGAWEVPVDDDTPDMRRYVSITPAGVALGDLVAIVMYTLVGGLILALTAILALVGLGKWEFWRAWRWGLALGLVPPGIVGLLFLRLIVALVNAALERILGRDLDNSGDVGDVPTEVRLIPINRSEKLIEGVDPVDLRYFIQMQEHRGSGQKAWRRVPLPSGRRCDDKYHTKMIQALERAKVWEGRGPRTAGQLQGEIEQVIGLLGLDS